MSNVIIFGMGCFVSLVVACAVGLLFWVAANEPREDAHLDKKASGVSSRSRSNPLVPAAAPNPESKSPA